MVVSMKRWAGKVAVVTGASAGIGAAIVRNLVSEGLIVVGIARRVEKIEAIAKTLSGQKGKLVAYKADITNEDEIVKAFQWIEENLGHVHVLVNNAGVLKENSLSEGKTEDWREVFEVNVLGLCTATREGVKIMRANNIAGHIIHINSLAGHQVSSIPKMNVYNASKFAVTGLTETLRKELLSLDTKIKVTSVSPGLTESEMSIYNKNYTPDRLEMLKQAPILKAEDVADAVVYALSTPAHVQIHELTIVPLGETF